MNQVRISDIAEVIRGVSYDKVEASDGPRDGFLPILRAGNISDVLKIDDDLVWVPATYVSTIQRIRAGDITICMSSGSASVVGKSALAESDWHGSVGAFCALVRTNSEKCLSEYLGFFLRSAAFRRWTREAQGANIKNIRKSSLEDFRIPLPPLAEQRRIVDLLSRAEGIVRLRREAEKKAAELIPALFLDMFGDPATNPKGWPIGTIGETSSLVTSGSTPRGGADVYVKEGPYFIRSQNVLMNRLDLSDAARITPDVHKQMARTTVKSGDVLLNITGASIGRVAWVEALDREANVNQHVCIIRPDCTAAEPMYLSVCLSMPYHQQHINTVQTGASRQALNHAQVRSLRVAMPPIESQRRFVERASSVISIQTLQSAATAKAQSAFDALLAQAFSIERASA